MISKCSIAMFVEAGRATTVRMVVRTAFYVAFFWVVVHVGLHAISPF